MSKEFQTEAPRIKREQIDYSSDESAIEAVRERRACFTIPLDTPYRPSPGRVIGIVDRFKRVLISSGELQEIAEERAQKVLRDAFQGIMESRPDRVSRILTEPILTISSSRSSELKDPFQH